jgi:hypothetical protein
MYVLLTLYLCHYWVVVVSFVSVYYSCVNVTFFFFWILIISCICKAWFFSFSLVGHHSNFSFGFSCMCNLFYFLCSQRVTEKNDLTWLDLTEEVASLWSGCTRPSLPHACFLSFLLQTTPHSQPEYTFIPHGLWVHALWKAMMTFNFLWTNSVFYHACSDSYCHITLLCSTDQP